MFRAGRIKPKYNARPSTAERRFHTWLIENFDCDCGCGAVSGVVHHPLERHPAQRWRRDHEYVVPMHGFCHMRLHMKGRDFPGMATRAAHYRAKGLAEGLLASPKAREIREARNGRE